MSYTPTEWKNGDIITEGKMNKIQGAIENLSMGGGQSGVFLVCAQYDMDLDGAPSVLDKTWDEIVSAIKNTRMLIVFTEINGDVFHEDSGERFFIFPGSISYNTINADQEPEKSINMYFDVGSEYRRYVENEDGVLVQVEL